MAEYVREASGFKGLKNAPKMREAIMALSDEAKRKKRLEAQVAEKQKQIRQKDKPQKVNEQEAEQIISKFRSVDHQIDILQRRAASMRARATAVDESGTGNKRAAATYRQVADGYLAQAAALRKKSGE